MLSVAIPLPYHLCAILDRFYTNKINLSIVVKMDFEVKPINFSRNIILNRG